MGIKLKTADRNDCLHAHSTRMRREGNVRDVDSLVNGISSVKCLELCLFVSAV